MSIIRHHIHVYSLSFGLFLGLFWETVSMSEYHSGLSHKSDAAYALGATCAFMAIFGWLRPFRSVKLEKGLRTLGVLSLFAGIFFPGWLMFLYPFGAFIFLDFIRKIQGSDLPARMWTGIFTGILLSQGILYTGILTEVNIMMPTTSVSAVIVLLWLWKSPDKSREMSESLSISAHQGLSLSNGWIMGTLAAIILTQWVFWHMFLSHLMSEKSAAYLFLTTLFFCMLGWRYYNSGTGKWHSPGVIFIATMMVTISLGWVYTSSVYWMFAFLFVPGISLMFCASEGIPLPQWNSIQTSFTLILMAMSWVVSGLYAQNHMDFVSDLGLSDDLVMLSFLQAWSKELASLAAIAMVLSGVRFLKPSWFFGSKEQKVNSLPKH